jgi:hypothetical protein
MSKKQQPELDAGTEATATFQLENVEMDPDVVSTLVASDRTKHTHWTQTLWGTHVRWACTYCPFDTLDGEAAMAEHYRVQHAPPPPPAPIKVVLVADRFGNVMR